jgi:hypothetical protein
MSWRPKTKLYKKAMKENVGSLKRLRRCIKL